MMAEVARKARRLDDPDADANGVGDDDDGSLARNCVEIRVGGQRLSRGVVNAITSH